MPLKGANQMLDCRNLSLAQILWILSGQEHANWTLVAPNLKQFLAMKIKINILLKRPLKSKTNYSNINYQIKGKAIRYDIFL